METLFCIPVFIKFWTHALIYLSQRLAEFNHRRKEEQAKENKPNLSYGVGVVIAVGVLGLLGYYIYQRGSPGDNNATNLTSCSICGSSDLKTSKQFQNRVGYKNGQEEYH